MNILGESFQDQIIIEIAYWAFRAKPKPSVLSRSGGYCTSVSKMLYHKSLNPKARANWRPQSSYFSRPSSSNSKQKMPLKNSNWPISHQENSLPLGFSLWFHNPGGKKILNLRISSGKTCKHNIWKLNLQHPQGSDGSLLLPISPSMRLRCPWRPFNISNSTHQGYLLSWLIFNLIPKIPFSKHQVFLLGRV